MATYKAQSPDGKVVNVTLPDGATDEQIIAEAQKAQGPPPGLTSPHMTSWSGGPESAKREGWGLLGGVLTLGAGNVASRTFPSIPKIAQVGGEMLGSLGSKAIETGATEGRLPTAGEATLSAAAPPAARGVAGGVGKVIKGARHLIPGHGIGEQAAIIDEMKDKLGKVVKHGDFNTTYNRLNKLWDAGRSSWVELPNTSAASQNTTGELQLFVRSLRENGMNRLADALESLTPTTLTGFPPAIPLNKLEPNMGAIGKLTQSAKPDLSGGAKTAYGAMKSDLERAASQGNVQAQSLLRAQKERGRYEVQKDINKLVSKASKPDAIDPRVSQFKPGTVTNPIKQPTNRMEEGISSRFKKRLTPEEQASFDEIIKPTYGRSSADVGQPDNPFQLKRRVPAMLIAGGLGGAGGGYLGGGPGVAAGVGLGIAAEEGIAKLMRTEGGKELIKKMMLNKLGQGPFAGPLGSFLANRGDSTSE